MEAKCSICFMRDYRKDLEKIHMECQHSSSNTHATMHTVRGKEGIGMANMVWWQGLIK